MNQIFFSHKSDNWSTPKKLYAELDAIWHFDHDPCPLNSDVEALGIFENWGFMNFVNPPYSNIKQFLQTAIQILPNGKSSVFLIPVRTSTKWFHDLVMPHATRIEFIKGRVSFGESKSHPPFDSMLVYFIAEGRQ